MSFLKWNGYFWKASLYFFHADQLYASSSAGLQKYFAGSASGLPVNSSCLSRTELWLFSQCRFNPPGHLQLTSQPLASFKKRLYFYFFKSGISMSRKGMIRLTQRLIKSFLCLCQILMVGFYGVLQGCFLLQPWAFIFSAALRLNPAYHGKKHCSSSSAG